MHILHISKYYFPYLGGVEGICKYLVERMPKHITSVVCFNNQRENAVDEINGHRIYRIATFVNIARQALSLSYKKGLRSLEQEFLLKATDIIKSSINKEMNVENLCDAMNMSRSSLYNKIKALTNDSPSDFIRKVRMNEASILLKSKRYTVSEVSDMMGFSDPKYFTDTFKKYYGVPPSTYMKQN